jgi:hypothetical protein
MAVVVERRAGLDVHRDDVVATMRVPGSPITASSTARGPGGAIHRATAPQG